MPSPTLRRHPHAAVSACCSHATGKQLSEKDGKAHVSTHLEHHILLWAPHDKRVTELLQEGQQGAMKIEGLGHFT